MPIELLLPAAGLVLLAGWVKLDRCRPSEAAALLFARLVLGAAVAIAIAVTFLSLLPGTSLLAALSHWCLHLPLLGSSVGVDGHEISGVALIGPLLVLAVSITLALRGSLGAARAVDRGLRRSALHEGPGGSLVVAGPTPIVAAAGLRSPRVVLSAAALLRFDDQELEAVLEHERAHIARRHRFVLLAARAFHALGRPIPGGRAAMRRLEFELERDADECAVARTGDRLALASAICKVAAPEATTPGLVSLGGGDVSKRLRLLCDPKPTKRGARFSAGGLAALAAVAAIVIGVQTPGALAAGVDEVTGMHAAHPERCDDV